MTDLNLFNVMPAVSALAGTVGHSVIICTLALSLPQALSSAKAAGSDAALLSSLIPAMPIPSTTIV